MFVLVLAAACGSKSKPADTTAKTMSGEHGNMSPELTKFHDVLKPRWHAEKGPQRMTDTCGAVAEFGADADALTKNPSPGADAAAWTTGTKELTEAVVALDGTCKANDATSFEPAFERVHKGFHALMELGGGHMEAHGEHDGHGGHGEHDGHGEHGEHDHKM